MNWSLGFYLFLSIEADCKITTICRTRSYIKPARLRTGLGLHDLSWDWRPDGDGGGRMVRPYFDQFPLSGRTGHLHSYSCQFPSRICWNPGRPDAPTLAACVRRVHPGWFGFGNGITDIERASSNWHIFILTLAGGLVRMFQMPAAQSLAADTLSPDRLGGA